MMPTLAVAARLAESDALVRWMQQHLDGMQIDALPTDRRPQLSLACWHVALEHSQAIVGLIHDGLYGSALALNRLLMEAFFRGMWLQYAATEAQLAAAGRDEFPTDFFGVIVKSTERALEGRDGQWSTEAARASWKQLCSFTHTGLLQIAPRSTAAGLGAIYPDEVPLRALMIADLFALLAVSEVARTVGNGALVLAALQRAVRLEGLLLPDDH